MSVKKIEEIPDLKPTIQKIFKESKVNLAPDTPMKNSRKAIVVDVDEEKDESSYKKFKYIKKEPSED
ncbi:hypothetical protein FRX31_016767 [Thalictrum thalictroides]|uniref:Uncharacterized protein n=1 Tax=Thalictrum thalictroides TaxID=46969 RepID=A0A7J6W9M1_THATH|nr:hypothetical protein FRX31_035402 [Thalictrum thalictroides]KAF5193647.1 hypothetical protein FRX31_016767 [Thalictrum thalictroides]